MASSAVPGRRRAARALLMLVTVAGTAGCSSVHPGAAAVVGQDRIDASTVDTIAAAYCSMTVAAGREQGNPSSDQPTRDLRRGVLNALVQRDVVSGAAQRLGGVRVREAQVRAFVDSGANIPQSTPAGDAATVRSFFNDVARTQLTLRAIGARLLDASAAGKTPTADEVVASGKRYVRRYAARLDIVVDPRYGSYSFQGIDVHSGSLSVPVSDEAVQAVRTNIDAAWAAQLPASQTCS